jgi:hypothetical protein
LHNKNNTRTLVVLHPSERQKEIEQIKAALKTVYEGLDGLEIDLNLAGLLRSREETGMKVAQRHRFAQLACKLEDDLRELHGEKHTAPAVVLPLPIAASAPGSTGAKRARSRRS